ncbi:transcriptional regulator (plasmid) [Rhizobium sp. ACO-34A]|nr:helix-turn-helix transcriptional regulator [Rhizobium sp. ACO-34A]ATN36820.1 transcriptional regulator [Rhizobium sp. ACO-34A]
MEIRDIFARNLRNRRNEKGLSQEGLAALANLDRGYISSLERRVYSPTIDTVDTLAQVLGIEAADLLKSEKANRPSRKQKNAAPTEE